MAREKKVIDASVLVKWFTDEAGTERAIALRDQHCEGQVVLIIPELALVEVANALRYKRTPKAAVQESIRDLFGVQLHVERHTQLLLERAAMLAEQHGLSVYGGVYAALAQIFGCPLVTEDAALLKSGIPNVVPLAHA